MADKAGERIKFETELLRLTSVAVLAIGGGSIGLMLGELSLLRVILAGSGLLATVGLMVVLWWQRRYIRTLIEQLKE
jgi:Na+/proline symporter